MKTCFLTVFLFWFVGLNAQSNLLRCNPQIILPADSVARESLINSLNKFLAAAQKPNNENHWVYEPEQLETYLLLNELKGISLNRQLKDSFFYKPYLTNVVFLKDSNYLLQVNYSGILRDTLVLRTGFKLLAHPLGDTFCFSSLFKSRTANWKLQKTWTIGFYYRDKINVKQVKRFGQLAKSFDRKLKCEKSTDYYCCKDVFDLQEIMGLEYQLDNNGSLSGFSSAVNEHKRIVILGNNKANFNEFDPHDLWHDRMSLVLPRNKANRPVDEGCAYLYGGSWGYTWKEIFRAFKEQIASNPNTNWMEVKETPVYFKSGKYSNSADHIVNALLVKKIEKDQGFSGVWEMLNVGPYEKGNARYYETLEKLTGITRESYNEKIWELIHNEK